MGSGGASFGSGVRRRAAPLAVLGIVAVAVAGCGAKDFANEPRAPAPIEVTAKVDDKQVVVSPSSFGAGLANITVANLSDSPVVFAVSGPVKAVSPELDAGGVTTMKVALKEGRYEVTAGEEARPDRLNVGAVRASAQNDVLLP